MRCRKVEAVIDTGFNGALALPPALITELGLPFVGEGRAILANGDEEPFAVYGVMVVWDGQPRFVETGAVGVDPLIGMALMDNYTLTIEIRQGGQVTIQQTQ